MRLTIELNFDQEAQLSSAAKMEGVNPAEFARKLVTDHLPPIARRVPPDPENQALIALLDKWDQEDATDDSQELKRRAAHTRELLHNLETNRVTLPVPEG